MLKTSKGYVYVIEDEFERVKIGKSINPEERIKAIATQAGLTIVNKYVTPLVANDSSLELHLHNYFGEYRGIGEWFNVSFEDVVKYIQSIALDIAEDDIEESQYIKSDFWDFVCEMLKRRVQIIFDEEYEINYSKMVKPYLELIMQMKQKIDQVIDNNHRLYEAISIYDGLYRNLQELSVCNLDDSEMYSELLDDLQRNNTGIDIIGKIDEYSNMYNNHESLVKRYNLYKTIDELEHKLVLLGEDHG